MYLCTFPLPLHLHTLEELVLCQQHTRTLYISLSLSLSARNRLSLRLDHEDGCDPPDPAPVHPVRPIARLGFRFASSRVRVWDRLFRFDNTFCFRSHDLVFNLCIFVCLTTVSLC
ncbi:hypothetical protein M6B38_132690 [Iris pallida]|uniref:Uncharacterized protein n=1 Tax=Iris pallida TaxID=29817 RepID=A0AAX6EKP5_IRIPA|nr:hypothetical protein M6B38_183540 [Iris pallida]KAJ6815768.1 hypothetical protein M6B38_132690 [Iris pallida]